MAEADRVGVDEAPPGIPRFLEDQRARLASALTPASSRTPAPSPVNPTVDFAQRLFGGSVSGASRLGAGGARAGLPTPPQVEAPDIPSFFQSALGTAQQGMEEVRGHLLRSPIAPILTFSPARAAAEISGLPEEAAEAALDSAFAAIPIGAVKGLGPLGKRITARSGEQVAAEIGEITSRQAANAEYIARATAERTPGFLRTAEDMLRANNIGQTSVAAQRAIQNAASKDLAVDAMRVTNSQTARLEANIAKGALEVPASQRTKDEVFREIGSNLGKLEMDEPVKELILANAARNYDEIARMSFTDQRRGVQTIAEQWEKAKRIIPDLDLKEALETRPGTAFNAETLLATQSALISKSDDVLKTAARLAENVTDADKARLIVEMTELSSLQRVFAGGRAEAGRALRALRQSVRPGESPRSMWEAASKFVGGREKGDEVVRSLVDIWADPRFVGDDAARDGAVFQFLRGLDSPGALDFVLEIRRNALLSGPPTLVVNLLGNTSVMAAERTLTRGVQAGWEAVLAAMGRRPNGREVFFSEVFPGIQGMTNGWSRGLSNAKQIAQAKMTGQQISKFVEQGLLPRGEATEALLRQAHIPQPIAGTVSAAINAPTRALAATDAIGYEMAWFGEYAAQGARQAAKEGLKGAKFTERIAQLTLKPTETMLKAATDHAKLVTLKSDPSAIADAVLRLRRSPNPAVKATANILFPFVQAPDNLIKLGGSYSPLGFIDAALWSGKAGGAARSAALARASVGSVGMYAFFLSKLESGEIDVTAGLPDDLGERRQFYAEGKIPYAVKIGENWYQFSRLEPFATPIKWMAAARDVYERNGRTLSFEIAAQMVGVGIRATLDASYLSGLSDLVEVMKRPDEQSVSAWLARTGGGFIPFSSLLRTTAYADDPFYRDPETALERIEAQLPWSFRNVKPVLEVTGQPAQRPESKQGLLGMVNPFLVSPERQNEIIATLNTLTTPETIGPDGEKIPGEPLRLGFAAEEIRGLKLTKDEGFRLSEVGQNLTMSNLTKLFQQQDFKGSVLWRQREMAEKAISEARDVARGIVADEILSTAKEPAQVARAAVMKVGTIESDAVHTRIGNVAKFVRDLQKRGLTSSEVKTELDRTRRAAESLDGKPDPTVDEMLRAAPLVDQYLAIPPYGTKARPYGNPAEWSALAEARRKMTAYLKENPKPPGMADWIAYSRADREGAALIRRYEIVGSSKERSALLKAHPEIDRYLQSTKVFD